MQKNSLKKPPLLDVHTTILVHQLGLHATQHGPLLDGHPQPLLQRTSICATLDAEVPLERVPRHLARDR